MFWSGNFIVVRELNFLLKEENVTLSQVLEADDILQECKADNKALMQFLTRPDILAELITLITEEPPQNVDLSQQYGHANMACEVLTSPLSMLSDRLSLDTTQMNRLCDFINKDPPLNPLLASYFSKTIEMLLERSPKQDWYLYHIVCLRVLDFFKSRRDFLPNLLRHISTSAIVDTFKYFIRLDDLFNKIVMEWLEEHQFLECLIQIICGTYVTEGAPPEEPEKGQHESSEKENHTGGEGTKEEEGPQDSQNNPATPAAEVEAAAEAAARRRRVAARAAAVASANAAALLCDLVATGCAADGAASRSRTSWVLVSRLAGAGGVRALLQGVFTSSGAARPHAIVNGCKLLLALLSNHPVLGAEGAAERSQVELAVAPHLPLLHQALLHHPRREERGAGGVGAARVHTAALLAHLALSEVEEVPTTMLTLGTPGVLVDMFFRFPHNNFLHAQLLALCRHALDNAAYRTQYARHLLVECDLLTRLMDAFEENENKQSESPRSGYMGHVTLILSCVNQALEEAGGALAQLLPAHAAQRWPAFRDTKLYPTLHQYDTPLGGSYPSENSYEVDEITDRLAANYDFNYAMATAGRMDEVDDDLTNDNETAPGGGGGGGGAHADSAAFIADGLGLAGDDAKQMDGAKSNFLELASQRFDDDMWDEAPEPEQPAAPALGDGSPWEGGAEGGGARAGEGWARFDELAPPPADTFADTFAPRRPYDDYWPYESDGGGSSAALPGALAALALSGSELRAVSLASNLLTAMSAMSPQAIANLVNANLDPLPPLEPAGNLAGAAGNAGESAENPADPSGNSAVSAVSPADSPGSPAKTTDSPEATSSPNGAEVDLPGADVESSFRVDSAAPAVSDSLPADTPPSPRVTGTEGLTDRSETPEKVNDASSADDRTSQVSSSSTKSSKGSREDEVLENANEVLEAVESAEEASER